MCVCVRRTTRFRSAALCSTLCLRSDQVASGSSGWRHWTVQQQIYRPMPPSVSCCVSCLYFCLMQHIIQNWAVTRNLFQGRVFSRPFRPFLPFIFSFFLFPCLSPTCKWTRKSSKMRLWPQLGLYGVLDVNNVHSLQWRALQRRAHRRTPVARIP